jgi:hypothetical protein
MTVSEKRKLASIENKRYGLRVISRKRVKEVVRLAEEYSAKLGQPVRLADPEFVKKMFLCALRKKTVDAMLEIVGLAGSTWDRWMQQRKNEEKCPPHLKAFFQHYEYYKGFLDDSSMDVVLEHVVQHRDIKVSLDVAKSLVKELNPKTQTTVEQRSEISVTHRYEQLPEAELDRLLAQRLKELSAYDRQLIELVRNENGVYEPEEANVAGEA